MAEKVPEGEFYSRLYVEPGAPKDDSKRLRARLAAYFESSIFAQIATGYDLARDIHTETGFDDFSLYHHQNFALFFKSASLLDVFTGITLVWRHAFDEDDTLLADKWHDFVERTLREENLKYRIDRKCGIHPRVDREFDRNRVSAIECLADQRYAAARHAADEAFDHLSKMPMEGKTAARSIFEAAESLTKTITGSGASLDEGFVSKELRPICDKLYANDAQLKSTAGGLLSSFAKWVAAMHPYRHGHEREQPLTLPDDVAIVAVSQGASFIRWLVDLDRRNQRK